MTDNPIAVNIKRFREAHQWSQEELAAASGVNVRTIQRAEAGYPLSTESLRALAAAFDTSIHALSLDDKEMTRALEEFQAKYQLVELEVIASGHELSRYLGGYHAYYLHRPLPLDEKQADRLAEFEQNLRDYGDIWSGLEPLQRRGAEKEMAELLDNLTQAGVSVSMGSRDMRIRPSDQGSPLRFSVLYVAAVPGATPLRFIAREKNAPIAFA
jgi:transcriptional regulator with XRE-family HTH domain